MKKLLLLFLMCFLLVQTTITFASPNVNQLIDAAFFAETPQEVLLDNNVTVKIVSFTVSTADGGTSSDYYYSKQGLFNMFAFHPGIEAVTISIHNATDKVAIIKWGESNLTIGNFSGIPFLDGMKFKDAGNPSATPDTLIPPGQTIRKTLNISSVRYGTTQTSSDDDWHINTEPIRKDRTTTATVTMKMLIGNNPTPNYYSVTSPAIVIDESQLKK